MEKLKLKLTNTTPLVMPPHGMALDYKNTIIPANKYAILSLEHVDELLETWVTRGWVKLNQADTGELLSKPSELAITAGTKINEVAVSQLPQSDDSLDEEIDFDPSNAREAAMPAGHMGDISQQSSPPIGARVSLGSESDGGANIGLSPIPGDRPRSVDDAEAFTVKAPRHVGPGAVIK